MATAKKEKPVVAAEPMTLLAITAAQEDLRRLIDENDGVMDETVEQKYDALNHSKAAKADAYGARMAALRATGEACVEEAKRLQARAKRCASEIEALERRLLLAMEMRQEKELEGTLFRFCRTPNPWKATVTADAPVMRSDINELPPELQSAVKVTEATAESYSWDSTALVALYKTRLAVLEEMKAAELPADAIATQEATIAELTAIATFSRGERLTTT
jgi:hypothetical protein